MNDSELVHGGDRPREPDGDREEALDGRRSLDQQIERFPAEVFEQQRGARLPDEVQRRDTERLHDAVGVQPRHDRVLALDSRDLCVAVGAQRDLENHRAILAQHVSAVEDGARPPGHQRSDAHLRRDHC